MNDKHWIDAIFRMKTPAFQPYYAVVLLLMAALDGRADEIELLNGSRVQGTITEQSGQALKIEIKSGERVLTRSFPIDRVRAFTRDGKKTVVGSDSAAPAAASPVAAGLGSDIVLRSVEAVNALIDQVGRTPPDWLKETLLEYPKTLDLSWPDPTPDIWNYTRNIEHYIWDIINSNPRRYRSGVRLMYHLIEVNQKDEGARLRAMNELARMYFEFFNDYARAAFWWREARVENHPKFSRMPSAAHLAECYWRLGNREMAVELLNRLPLTPAVIKAWGNLKETEKAIQLGEEGLRLGFMPTQMYLLAGDACRTARNFSRATEYYRKVMALPSDGKDKEQIKRDQERAAATLEVIRLFDTVDVTKIANGVYEGKSLGYAGDVEMEVTVQNGRIEALKVKHHSDRQYYHAIEDTIRRIMARQSVNGVDAISGATFTSEAVIRATAKALAEGME